MTEDIANYAGTSIGVDLSGIALFAGTAPEPSKRNMLKGIKGIRVMRGTVLRSSELEKPLKAFLGKPISPRLLEEIRRAIIKFYETRGYLVSVPLSNQDAANGVLQFGIAPRYWREITVEGKPHFNAGLYRRPFSGFLESPVIGWNIPGRVASLERNPFRTVTYTPADMGDANDPGATRLRLEIAEKFPLSLSLGVDNQGVPILGEERYSFGLTTTDPFHWDHVIQYRFITTEDSRKQTAHYLTYLMPSPLNYQHSIQFSGIYSQSKATTVANGAEIRNTGKSAQATLGYTIPLPRTFSFATQEVSFGFDFKSSDSNFDFGGTTFSKTGTETFQFWLSHSIALEASKQRWVRSAGLTNRLIMSPGGFTGKNTDTAYQTIRPGSSSSYVYWKADFSLVVGIPESLLEGMTRPLFKTLASDTLLSLTAETQISTANLLPAEQLSFGGATTVRGFEENAQLVDEGLLLKAELYSPAFSILPNLVQKIPKLKDHVQDQARVFAFFDYGFGQMRKPREGEENDFGLGSVGVGVAYSMGSRFRAKVAYGWQVIETHFQDDRQGRLHFEAALSW